MFTLRPATAADHTYLARLFYLTDVFGDETADVSPEHVSHVGGYVSDWSPEMDGGVIAVSADLVPAGGLWLRHWANSDAVGWANLGPEIPELAIAVEPRFNAQGLGRRLLTAGVALARSQGASTLALSVDPRNPRARQVYEKFGFRDVGTEQGRRCGIMTVAL